MNVEMSVPEVVEIFKEIQEQPKQIFEMIRVEIRENVGQYLSKLMAMELTHFCQFFCVIIWRLGQTCPLLKISYHGGKDTMAENPEKDGLV